MYKFGILICAAVFCVLSVCGDVSELPGVVNKVGPNPVTDICLGCICEAVSNCNRTLTCDGSTCGLFKITWVFWSDSGKPTNNGEPSTSQTAYENCVNEPFCAARAVQGYMSQFGQDCNGDGQINCYDFAAIHKLGGYGCSGPLPDWYKARFDQCLTLASQLSG